MLLAAIFPWDACEFISLLAWNISTVAPLIVALTIALTIALITLISIAWHILALTTPFNTDFATTFMV